MHSSEENDIALIDRSDRLIKYLLDREDRKQQEHSALEAKIDALTAKVDALVAAAQSAAEFNAALETAAAKLETVSTT